MNGLSPRNVNKLPEIHREIVAAYILSKDGKMLMGKKDPNKGGVYPNAWHIPGGGQERNETFEDTLRREINQEVLGINLEAAKIKKLAVKSKGESQKTLKSGEVVWCKMDFNYFDIRLNKTSAELNKIQLPGDDLVMLRWFSPKELSEITQIPGGKETMMKAGYIKDE